MTVPEHPHPPHTEGELRDPRPGFKMAVDFINVFGQRVSPAEHLSPADSSIHYTRLHIQDEVGAPIIVRKAEYNPKLSYRNSATIIADYIRDGDFSTVPDTYKDTFFSFAMEVAFLPPNERSQQIVLAEVPDEALFPDNLDQEVIVQFLLTQKTPTLDES